MKLNCFEVIGELDCKIGKTKSIFYFSVIKRRNILLKSINHLMNGDILTLTNITHRDSFN